VTGGVAAVCVVLLVDAAAYAEMVGAATARAVAPQSTAVNVKLRMGWFMVLPVIGDDFERCDDFSSFWFPWEASASGFSSPSPTLARELVTSLRCR
jgi:hypothetical protein